MKKLLFFPLILLVLFAVTSCNDDDDDTPVPAISETEQLLMGNWKMNSDEYKYYDANGNVVHTTSQTDLNNLFEYKTDNTVRFKIGEDPTWYTRKFDIETESTPKMLNVFNAAGDEVEIAYKIQKLTATEMVLVHEYNNETYEKDGETFEAAKVAKTYTYVKQ